MLKLEHIYYTYKNNQTKNSGVEIFKDLSLVLEKGRFVSVVGPSGCGKTTLVNIIAGYIKPDSGKILINNKQVIKPGRDRVVLNQEDDLFKWLTVKENIKIAINKKGVDFKKYLSLVHLESFGKNYSHQLSGGMKKRVSLARALATQANFIIMDEPFSSLDYQIKEELHTELLNIWESTEKTILLITHDIEEAIFLSNQIIVMSNKPARVKKIINIPFPYPRTPDIKLDSSFIKMEKEIKELLNN